jgi:hypothetical protein
MKELERSDANASDETESRVENLPAVAKEAEEAWAKIEQSNLGDRMKRALRRIAGGGSIRGAAEAEGYTSHSDVYRYAKRFGIADERTRAIINAHRSVAKLAGEEMVKRLTENPDEIKTPALAIIGGISTDKVLAHEKSQTDDGSSYISALEKVAAEILASGKSLELKVSVGPTLPTVNASGSHEVIDVTPESPI